MKINHNNLCYAMLLFILAGCATQKITTKNNKSMNELKVTDQVGIIDYWQEIDKYTISFSVPNTIDSRITVIIERASDIPKPLKKSGTKVVLSGTIIKNSNLPAPRMGGEQVYSLHQLIAIKGL